MVVPRDADLVSAIGSESVDVVIDLVGGPALAATAGQCFGRAAATRSPARSAARSVELDLRTLYLKDLTLLGCTSQDAEVFPNLVGYLERGELVPLVARTYPLEAIAEAQRDFEAKRHVGKLVLLVPPAG